MKKYSLITFSVVVLVAVIVYYRLGGGAPVQLSITERSQHWAIGEHFEGHPNDPKLEELFVRSRDHAVAEGRYLIVINYKTEDKGNRIKQFIGVVQDQSPPELEEGLSVVELPKGKYVKAELSAHNFVMPRPDEVKDQALEFAAEREIQIETNVSYEVYESDRKLIILFYSL